MFSISGGFVLSPAKPVMTHDSLNYLENMYYINHMILFFIHEISEQINFIILSVLMILHLMILEHHAHSSIFIITAKSADKARFGRFVWFGFPCLAQLECSMPSKSLISSIIERTGNLCFSSFNKYFQVDKGRI